jgi:hypothetical protein
MQPSRAKLILPYEKEYFMELANKLILPGIALILTLAFGFWLSSAGKPYNGILFNIHKLIALAGVILAVVQLTKLPHLPAPFSLFALCLILAALAVIALFATGGLLSAEKLDYSLMLTIHRVGIAVLVVALGAVVYLVIR